MIFWRSLVRIIPLPLRIVSPWCLVVSLLSGSLGTARGDWQLAWSDEFDGSAINTNNWTFDIGNGSGGWGNNEKEYYTSRPQNVYVTNGILHIIANKESYGGQNYTSAKLKTLGLFSQTYGRFEFRAKLPQGQGYWPALWMMPEDGVYGGWAASGEIDVMENKGSNPTNVTGTIHFGGRYPNQAQSYGPSFNFPSGDSVTNFHVYALEWSAYDIRWYVDDQLYEIQTFWWSSSNPTNTSIRNPYPAPFDQPFYIIINLAVGGNFGGDPDGTTVFPGDMQVDYVRVYDRASAPPPPPILILRVGFDDARGSTTTSSDTNGGGANVTLQMEDGTGASSDYHGAAGSGVAGAVNGNRALDFSSNGPNQPGNPGPLASVTNASLGFGTITNFIATMWFKQNALMTPGNNIGPRLFVLGTGTPADTGVPNSIGFKFQTDSQIYFQIDGVTASATFPTNLPANTWLFFAAVYDGTDLLIYQGSDIAPAVIVSSTATATNVNFGNSAALYVGNRQNLQRSFDGWIDDIRFYNGTADGTFVENIRLLAASPPSGLSATPGNNQVALSWTAATGATGYNVKRSATGGGPYATLGAGTNVSGTNFTDLTAINGNYYYYVVSAINAAGEGAISSEAAATPQCVTPPAPVAANNSPIFNGMTLNLTASPVAGASYNWTGPNGFTSSNQNPSIINATTNASGIYSVMATVGGCTSTAATTMVTVNLPVIILIQNGPDGIEITWPNGTLQSATNILGPWYNLGGAASPYVVTPAVPQQFYRIKL
jgi:beta-glucanase (GH16 family)